MIVGCARCWPIHGWRRTCTHSRSFTALSSTKHSDSARASRVRYKAAAGAGTTPDSGVTVTVVPCCGPVSVSV